MKTIVLVVGLALAVSACGTDQATDGASSPSSSLSPSPAAVPSSPVTVRSRHAPTVLDVGDGGPVLCLGPVAESYPPQCTGPAVVGWDWEGLEPHVERQGGVRWGEYAVAGTWDGRTFTVSDAVPAALHAPASEAPALPKPAQAHDEAELAAIVDDLDAVLPGLLGAFVDQSGHVLVDVEYDDGSLQALADETYGDGVVVVSGSLVDAPG